MSDTPDEQSAEREVGRRPVVGALAAGLGLSALGGTIVAAQDDDPGGDGNETDGNLTDGNQTDGDADGLDGGTGGDATMSALSGANHGVFTDASGCANFTGTEDGLAFDLLLEDIEYVTQAHIHEGDASVGAGPVVAPLVVYNEELDGTGEGEFRHATHDSPIFESGTVDDADLADQLFESPSDYYVNVHTTQHPDGEIRGQVRGQDVGAVPGDVPGEPGDGNVTEPPEDGNVTEPPGDGNATEPPGDGNVTEPPGDGPGGPGNDTGSGNETGPGTNDTTTTG